MSLYSHSIYGSREAYLSALKQFIKDGEGGIKTIYSDTAGYPTIGIGYALVYVNSAGSIIENSKWEEGFEASSINLTSTQISNVNSLIDAVVSSNQPLSKATTNTLIQENNVSDISLSTPQMDTLYTHVITKVYEANVKSYLGETAYNLLENSKEMVALVSMDYNNVGLNKSPSLKRAILDNNRVNAWYEIRYNSNDNNQPDTQERGIANRRMTESDMFGLYSSADGNIPQSDNEAKNVIRFLEAHRATIQAEINHVRSLPGNNNELNLQINDLDIQLQSAKNLLTSNYAQGVNIDGDIVVGDGIGGIPESYSDTSEASTFADFELYGSVLNNDLIFGERGNDIIEDSDATGEIYFNTDSLKGIEATNTLANLNVYNSTNYTFTKSGNNLTVLDKSINEEITIENFFLNGKKDDNSYSALGITLDNYIEGGVSTCRELKVANNIFTCRLHVEQKQNEREVA